MKYGLLYILILASGMMSHSLAQNPSKAQIPAEDYMPTTALLLIDIQEFYFPGGKIALDNPETAGMNAGLVLERFRDSGMMVIHVRHDYEPGGSIHDLVRPEEGEMVITKKQVNAFLGTELLLTLEQLAVDQIVFCGMQTHMCLEAAVRAAHDFGYKCIVIEDACATRALQYKEYIVPAKQVHYSTLSSLKGVYATLLTTDEFLKSF